jgi:hypothetical protein
MRSRRRSIPLLLAVMAALVVPATTPVLALPNPVAVNDAEYLAFGRVFSDPQGCLVKDTDGDGVNDVVPAGASPWAKGNMCMGAFLSYEEAIEGSKYLASRFPRFLQVIRLDEAYDDPNMMSAGIPRAFSMDEGTVKPVDRDRRPLYMMKVTDTQSPIAENMRLHFVYAGSIHGIERAGAEGSLRAMEDLVTWAANTPDKKIVEAPTDKPVPTAGETLSRSVIYFLLPNPDGWARGQVAPAELEDGSPNLSYTPGAFFQRYNGNGMDLNRDWPGMGYSYRPYSPGSEPEVRAYMKVLRSIRANISPNNPVGQRFAGGIDLHGQLVADAFSYTLLGAGQRDYRKNLSTVDQGLRTWNDQTARMAWSPYIGTVFPVADQWGTVIDTLGYQVTGALGDWIENEEIGLGAVGIDNEMSLSHLAPNNVFDPTTEQMHVDGNKGLIFSQLASMLTEPVFEYQPKGKVGYIVNPVRITNNGMTRVPNPGLPAQNNIDLIVPSADPNFHVNGTAYDLEFDVNGPNVGIFNGGITGTMTNANASGLSSGTLSRLSLQRWDDDMETWENLATAFVQAGAPDAYLQSGQIVTVNDPIPGRYRLHVTNGSGTGAARLKVDFSPVTAETSPGQAAFSVSSMDFFTDLNKYIADPAKKLEPLPVTALVYNPSALDHLDTVVVVNNIGQRDYLKTRLHMSDAQIDNYFGTLRTFVNRGGNLLLTDGSLAVLGEMGVVPADQVRSGLASTTSDGQAASYQFNVPGRGNQCNVDKLLLSVCLPGTAGGTQRVAVEPTPLGYAPDGTLDDDPAARIKQWWVQRSAWENGCGKANAAECTTALMLGGEAGIGERHIGQGVVRIAGAMFPDPNFAPSAARDMRFGLQSYALSFSAWQIFLNLVDYQRPAAPPPPPPQASPLSDLTVSAVTPTSKVSDKTARLTASVKNVGTGLAAISTTTFVLDGTTTLGSIRTTSVAPLTDRSVSVLWSTAGIKGLHTITVTTDAANVVSEANDSNNVATLVVKVKKNKVKVISFTTQ